MTAISANRIETIIEKTLQAAHRQLVQPNDSDFVEAVLARIAKTQLGVDIGQIADETIIRAIKFTFSLYLHHAYFQDSSAEQEQAFQAAQAYLYPILLRELNGDEDAASDLTQQALSQVWKRGPSLREPGAFLNWTLATARATTL